MASAADGVKFRLVAIKEETNARSAHPPVRQPRGAVDRRYPGRGDALIGTAVTNRLRRHRRLLALCGLSALVHLALLEWVAATGTDAPPPLAGPLAAQDLVLRLVPADTPRREDRRRADATTAAPTAAQQRQQQQAARPTPQARTATGASTAAPAPPAALATAAAVTGQPTPDAAADAPPLVQMPTRYRVRMPDPVLITYAQARQAAGAAPQPLPDARLDWRSNGERYLLKMDGVLGRLSSEGGSGDAGVRPTLAADDSSGESLSTEFADGEVRFRASGRSLPGTLGIQDRASLLMQLAGIGLAEPDQVQGTIEVVVAGSADAAIERYEVAGKETLATPLGPIEAWHLAAAAVPGRQRLEIWLAPARGWLPVQLRLTGADGVALTQTVSAIAPQPQAAP